MLIKIDDDGKVCDYIRIDKGDTFDCYVTMAQVLAPMVRQLHGKSYSFINHSALDHHQLRFDFMDQDDDDKSSLTKYNSNMEDLIWFLERCAYDDDADFEKRPHVLEREQSAKEFFMKYFRALWE